jgi:4-amino-4-deoxy-L-arabinose transferase-like glycosyltransferase
LVSKTENRKPIAAADEQELTRLQVFLALAGILFLNLLLRVFYLRYDFVNGDEGVRALAATQLLDGARLYADVVTDKPAGATLFYATVFALFGRSMKAVHLAAAAWNFITSLVIYLIGARFLSKRAGLWAALLFVYFSTNYLTQDMMAANTELLMAVFYTASFYLFLTAHRPADAEGPRGPSAHSRLSVFAAGLMTGLAAMFKQTGVLGLVFFALYEIIGAYAERPGSRGDLDDWIKRTAKRSIFRLSLIAAGFAVVLVSFLLWLILTATFSGFWRNAVTLNLFYIDSVPVSLWLRYMVGRGGGYVLFNATLWSLALWTVARSIRSSDEPDKAISSLSHPARRRVNLALALWGAVSLSSVMISGRFFGHYFITALPALALLAAQGVELISERMRDPARKRSARVAIAVLGSLFLVGLVRSHHRTAILAYETLTGRRTLWSERWGMTIRQKESEAIAESLRDKIREGEPLYIWGYANDVYWRTGCRPASRYLTPYYIDGRFPDAESAVVDPNNPIWRETRENLVEDLRRTRPRLILDVYASIKQLPYTEIVDFVNESYQEGEDIGPDPSRPFRTLWLKEE